jgi:integrase
LGAGKEWIFQSSAGTPVNPSNALKRYLHPAAKELGMKLSGWHDFRHSFQTNLRKKSVHPKVISSLMGHAKVQLGMNIYDHADMRDLQLALAVSKPVVTSLLPRGVGSLASC